MAILKDVPTANKTIAEAVSYVLRGDRNDGRWFLHTHFIRAESITDIAKEFRENDAIRVNRYKNSKQVKQNILSFHTKDSTCITKDMMLDLTKKWIKLFARTGLAIAAPHFDTDEVHIHFLFSVSETGTGQSLWMTKEKFHEIKIELQNYQKKRYPELEYSIVELQDRTPAKRKDRDKAYYAKKKEIST